MTFKKRAILTLCTILFSCVLATATVIVVFAVEQVGLTTNINVTYTSDVVGVRYGLKYKNSTDTGYTYLDKDVSLSSEGNAPAVATSDISEAQIVLNADNPYCIICWEFVRSGASDFTASLTYEDTGDEDGGFALAINSATNTLSSWNTISSISTRSGVISNYIQYFAYKITMNSKYEDVVFSGNFNWTFTSSIT